MDGVQLISASADVTSVAGVDEVPLISASVDGTSVAGVNGVRLISAASVDGASVDGDQLSTSVDRAISAGEDVIQVSASEERLDHVNPTEMMSSADEDNSSAQSEDLQVGNSVFFPPVLKHNHSKKRVCNKHHACFFCSKLVTKTSKHLLQVHKKEKEVKKDCSNGKMSEHAHNTCK